MSNEAGKGVIITKKIERGTKMIKRLLRGRLTNFCAVCPKAGLQPSAIGYCASTCAQTPTMIRGQNMAPVAYAASAYNRNKPPVFKIIEGTKPYPTLVRRGCVSRTVKPHELPKILSISGAYSLVERPFHDNK